ncbi:GAF domain-containing protein [Mesorhizobium sp. M0808]|uniref:GAF domain-containing protein n=1 Tax=Mesorhizobium sp. M0808 TaxID=2957002 RepID=UPI00333830F4
MRDSIAELEARIALLTRELSESRAEQTAASEILRVIAASPTDIQPVLNAVAERAAQLCDAFDAIIFLRHGELLVMGAHHGPIPVDFAAFPIARDWVTGRAVIDRAPTHVHDLLAAGDEFPTGQSMARRLGHRTILATPLLREDEAIGGLVIRRTEVRPFSDKQISLLKTFADQAVIAIGNVRLFEEVQARNHEVTEALEQQTATGAILRVIASSPTDIQPVLQVVAESAAQFCDTNDVAIFLPKDGALAVKAHYGPIPLDMPPEPIARNWVTGRAFVDRETLHIHDLLASGEEFPVGQAMAQHAEHRTIVATPLMRDDKAIGVLVIRRNEVRPFSDKQINLLKTFADQAVIAIENVRLFDEVQARNREVTEALQQQTATAEVLKTISSSAFDLDAVLHTLVKSASDLCHAAMGCIYLRDDDVFRPAMQVGWTQEFYEYMSQHPMRPGRGSVTSRAALTASIVHIPDALDDPEYTFGGPQVGHFRTLLGVPLIRDGNVTGVFVLARPTVKPFSQREIELVQTFSDQALIALENVRLFDEVQARNRALTESLEQQTATNDILSVISSSPTNLQPVFDMIAERSACLCDAEYCVVFRFDGQLIHFVAQHGLSPVGYEAMARAYPMPPGRTSTTSRAVMSGKLEQIPDVQADPDYAIGDVAKAVNARSITSVPMLKNNRVIGAINVARSLPGLFAARQIALLQTFADQAVIAIENVRLFDELQARTAELGEALKQQTATADVLKVISRSAFDLSSVLQALIESAAGLCNARTSGIYMLDGGVYRLGAAHGQSPEFRAFEEAHPDVVGRGSWVGRAALERSVVHIPDASQDTEHQFPEVAKLGGFASILCVPLMRQGQPIGVFALTRPEVGPFTDREIELVQTFADQAVIAIENARLFEEVQARTAELGEALQQQTATADVLKVISRSAFDLQTVLDTLVESAIRVCEAEKGAIFQRNDDLYHFAASFGFSEEYEQYARENPVAVAQDSITGRVALEAKTIHIADVLADPAYKALGYQQLGGYRTCLGVPLLSKGLPVGVFVLTRPVVKPFTGKQIELVETYADQAVIAIENVRLFDEVQARTAELGEALQQQTATADVLKVISRSAFDLQTVLDTLTQSAAQLCEADMAGITRQEGEGFYYATNYNLSSDWQEYVKDKRLAPGRGSVVGRALLDRKIVHVADVLADREYTFLESTSKVWFRTVLGVPLMREGNPIGVLVLARQNVQPFTDKQIDLIQTFADQAVIAIENARLFDEVQARTAELSESLQQQTATADVLKAISRSTFDLRAVLDALAESVTRLCEADNASIVRETDGKFVEAASYGYPAETGEYFSGFVHVPGRGTGVGRVLLEGKAVQIPDVLADAEYTLREGQRLGGYRTVLAVPLLREGLPIGVFSLTRSTVRPFTERQIELVETFADQAVIAIENVRLFDEVQARTAELSESLQQQTATADVLKAISRSTFDLQPVLDTLAESAAKLCDADTSVIFKRDGDLYRWSADYANLPEAAVFAKANPFAASRDSVTGRVALEARAIHVSDVLADPEYGATQLQKLGGYRTILCVPILREGAPVGVFALTRSEVRDFTPRQIELVETFADQSGIAIENVRLFDEVQARTRELGEALQQQTATADVLKVISRSAFDLQTVLDTLTESAVRLCRADKGALERLIDGGFRYVAMCGFPATFRAYGDANPTQPGRGSAVGRAVEERRIIQIDDILDDPEYTHGAVAEAGGIRTVLAVPLLRQDELIGVFAMIRAEPNPFTTREIELVKTFADQAVIAIENVRLFDEVQARTRELSRSLEDLRTAQDRLVQTEKLASLGQLTAGIAHEIKNPLNFVNNFSALSGELIDDLSSVLAGAPLEESVRDEVAELTGMLKGNLDKVVQHGKRADSIVRNMLLHSRAGSGEHRPIDINAVVEESLNLAYHGARAEKPGFNVTLTRSFDPQAGDVDLYPQEITRVLLNLISNGFYATAKRSASANGAGYEPTLSAATRSLGDRVEISIRDNGTGIPPEVKEKMFNPFFTTKPAGEGTGLGLSLSHDIVVKQHAGTIDVDSQPGEFTEFRIVLPRAAASLAKSAGEA